jgi:parallel beta-helix repeat protein
MSDGTISGNIASSYGGGVLVYNSGTFTMNGGTVSGNSSTKAAGCL